MIPQEYLASPNEKSGPFLLPPKTGHPISPTSAFYLTSVFLGKIFVGGRVMGSKEALFLKENRKKQRLGGGFKVFLFNYTYLGK